MDPERRWAGLGAWVLPTLSTGHFHLAQSTNVPSSWGRILKRLRPEERPNAVSPRAEGHQEGRESFSVHSAPKKKKKTLIVV